MKLANLFRTLSNRQHALQHAKGVEAQAQQAVHAAGSHVKEVEPRATRLLAQMQDAHLRGMAETQSVANQAHQDSQNKLQAASGDGREQCIESTTGIGS